jgi:aldehyde dehydrogenase (NAD+)
MPAAAKPTALLRIGNEDVATGSGGTYTHRHPLTGEAQAQIPLAGQAEMDRAVSRAAAAFEDWRNWKPEARRDVLIRLTALIRENKAEFARLAALDNGTPLTGGHILAEWAADWTAYYAGWTDKLEGQLLSTYGTRGEFAYTAPEPLGVVGIIITWNGPIISLGMKAAPALAAGNCVVIKPSEMTPFAPDYYAVLAREAGLPDGVLSMLPGGPEAGEALVRNPLVEKISFTGGPIAARKILNACAEQLKPAVLELGGKSANLLFPDADIEAACQRAVGESIGILAGQGCALPMRLLVHASIYQQVLDRVVEIASGYKVGNPFEEGVRVGPLINAAACDRVMGILERMKAAGSGRILLGGQRGQGVLTGGNFIEPTIVADADPAAEISQVEIFGPVLVVTKFANEDEAVAIANATPYGLAAYIQTSDVKRAHRLSERLKAGGIYINGGSSIRPQTPFGGIGLSGYGREGGRAGIDEFLRYKTVTIA